MTLLKKNSKASSMRRLISKITIGSLTLILFALIFRNHFFNETIIYYQNLKSTIKITIECLEKNRLKLDENQIEADQDLHFYTAHIDELQDLNQQIINSGDLIKTSDGIKAKFSAVFIANEYIYAILTNGEVFRFNELLIEHLGKLDVSNLDGGIMGGMTSAKFIPSLLSNGILVTYSLRTIKDKKYLFLDTFDFKSLKKISEYQLTYDNTAQAELGGGMVFDKENLYLNVGIAGNAAINKQSMKSQNMNSIYGKIIKIPLSNLLSQKTLNYYIYSFGHKHLQGLFLSDGSLFGVEHSINGGDELNQIFEGGNYGYPLFGYTLTNRTSKTLWMNVKGDFVAPIYYFSPSIAPADITQCPFDGISNYAYDKCIAIASLAQGKIIFMNLHKRDEIENSDKIYYVINSIDLKTKSRVRRILIENKKNILYYFTDDLKAYKVKFIEKNDFIH